MANPVVFCDIDGVFNGYSSGELAPIDLYLFVKFKSVIQKYNAKIVFTSSQRKIKSLSQILVDNKLALGTLIHKDWKTPILPSAKRGDEVTQWIRKNAKTTSIYVCIDDNSDYKSTQPLIRTNTETGLTEQDIDILDKLLEYLPIYRLHIKPNEDSVFREYRRLYRNLKNLELMMSKSRFGRCEELIRAQGEIRK